MRHTVAPMGLELKLDNGAPVVRETTADGRTWKGPVYVNDETQQEIVLDANRLFTSNADLRTESQTRREALERTTAQLKAAGLDPAKPIEDQVAAWKRAQAEAEELRAKLAKKGGEPRDPTPEELEAAAKVQFGEVREVLEAKAREAATEAEKHKTRAAEVLQTLQETMITSDFTRAAVESGVRKGNIPDVLLAAKAEWELDEKNRRLVTYDGIGDERKLRRGTDPEKPMSPDEWMAVQKRNGRDWWPQKATAGITLPGGDLRNAQDASTPELFSAWIQPPTN